MGKLSLDFISVMVQIEPARNANAKRSGFPFQNLIDGTRSSVPRRSFRRWPGEGNSRGRTSMINATEYRAMAAEHHRLAGMCRSPESPEQHLRLEQALRALAEREERLHEPHVAQHAGDAPGLAWFRYRASPSSSLPMLTQMR